MLLLGKLSQLVLRDLGQNLPILPVASCAVSETLPGTFLSWYQAQIGSSGLPAVVHNLLGSGVAKRVEFFQ